MREWRARIQLELRDQRLVHLVKANKIPHLGRRTRPSRIR
jgi:hypothetical protein